MKNPEERVVDDLLARHPVATILRGVAEGMRRHARSTYGHETSARFDYESSADSLLDFAAALPRRLTDEP